ncbi:LuxR family transcriptional regulator [Streptomyces sp. NPDC093224]|uniref:helix-turn-helix transcriptional regulator n=1 Tax=Streptomyces sp. NPDC093224 TaxID=3155198 RepID=UPI00343F7A6E
MSQFGYNSTGIAMPMEAAVAAEVLKDQLADVMTGSGRLVIVNGGLASGKTTLLDSFVNSAHGRGATTLTATCARDERALGLGVIDQLRQSAGMPAVASERLARLLGDSAARQRRQQEAWTGRGVVDADIQHIRDICDVFLKMADERPIVIAVDDLQFADEQSMHFLLQLHRRIRSSHLLLVLNQWDRPHKSLLKLHADLTRHAHETINLRPLSVKSVSGLFESKAGRSIAPERIQQVHDLTAGNPLLTNALIDDWIAAGTTGLGNPTGGPAYSEALTDCLQRWDAVHLEIAQAVAILSDRSAPEFIAPLLGASTHAVNEVLEVLTAAGILADGRFRCATAADTVLTGMAPADQARMHSRAGELVHQRGGNVLDVAHHLLAAGATPDEWAVPVLRSAAEQAESTGQVEFLVHCLELALAASCDEQERGLLIRMLARTNWRRNPLTTSLHIEPVRHSVAEGAADFRDALTLSRHALWYGEQDLFSEAFAALTRSADVRNDRSQALVTLACQWYFPPFTTEWLDPGKAQLEASPWTRIAYSLARVWTHGPDEAVVGSAEQILRSCRLDDTSLEALATAVIALAVAGKSQRADWWCRQLVQEAERQEAPTWSAVLTSVSAWVLLRRGETQRAADQAQAALGMLDPAAWGTAVSMPLSVLVLANTQLGLFPAAIQALRHPVPDAMLDTAGGLQYLWARGRYHLATGRALAAVSDFTDCRELTRQWGVESHILAPWQADLNLANAQLGYPAAPLRQAVIGTPPAARSGASGPVAIQRPRLPEQRRAPHGVSLEPALTALGSGGGTDDPADSTTVLSDAEQRVAHLAVRGKSNRQIASLLFITVSTVEQHLTRVYRKLGVKGRSDLPADLDIPTGSAEDRSYGSRSAYHAEISTRSA